MKQVWDTHIVNFELYLRLEKSLSQNSIDAYLHDVVKLCDFFILHDQTIYPEQITGNDIRSFILWINGIGIGERSQARIMSGLKAFFYYLRTDNIITDDPTELIDLPKIGRKLPDVLSIQEIDAILQSIDYSKAEGQRNRAIIETLYSCGLRVSELVTLQLSNIHALEGYVRIIGKGNKERLVPISKKAIFEIKGYLEQTRNHQVPKKGEDDIVFLNRRGRRLSRVMIFTIIKNAVMQAEITKQVSPHTFRHSFATHLVDGGADLRAVQDMLGHESITTTEIYTHLNRQHLVDTIMMYHPRSRKF